VVWVEELRSGVILLIKKKSGVIRRLRIQSTSTAEKLTI
jgi:hypothetical protein